MKRKNLQQTNTLHARISVTEPAEYVHHPHHAIDTQPMHTETSESGRNKNKRNIPQERVSVSLKSRSKGMQKDTFEKKDSASRLQGSKPKIQIKEMLKSSQKVGKKAGEDAKDIKKRSPEKIGRATVQHRENVPPQLAAAQKVANKTGKPATVSKVQPQPQVKKSEERSKYISKKRFNHWLESVKSNTRGREPQTQEKTIERSPMRDTAELDKFVQYNAMRIMGKSKIVI